MSARELVRRLVVPSVCLVLFGGSMVFAVGVRAQPSDDAVAKPNTGAELDWWTSVEPDVGTTMQPIVPSAAQDVKLSIYPQACDQGGQETCAAFAAEAAEAVLGKRSTVDAAQVLSTYDQALRPAVDTRRASPIPVVEALGEILKRQTHKLVSWVRLGRNAISNTGLVNEMAASIARGQPVVLVIPVDAAFRSQTADSEPYPGCRVVGDERCERYHAMLVIGVSRTGKALDVLNSYGPNWGSNGTGRIAFSALNGRLQAISVLDDVNTDEKRLTACSVPNPLAGGARLQFDEPNWIVDNLPIVQGLGRVAVDIHFVAPGGLGKWVLRVELVDPTGQITVLDQHSCAGGQECSWAPNLEIEPPDTSFVLRVSAQRGRIAIKQECALKLPAPPSRTAPAGL